MKSRYVQFQKANVLFMAAFFLICSVRQINAQDAVTETGEETEEETLSEEELYRNTLSIDITTADYTELVAWCRRLGLDEGGAKTALQKRIAEYYGISLSEQKKKPDEQEITVVSANELRYFTDEASDESYVFFNGNVEIKVADKKNGSVHTVRAESVVYNQTRKLLFAGGDVEYVLSQEGSANIFKGDSLMFDIDTFEGSFYEGVSQKESTLEDETITFYFSGKTIERTEGNVITLENGVITSCDKDDPHYMIKARKIWVIAPGEWAIQDAVLYIGRIPILYIPFFFKPGDEFFFHPVAGYRDREGYYVQTTSYLYGRREQKESSFSFLQLTESDTSSYELKREGLFLTKDTASERKKVSEDYVKILFDMYSRLGFYGAIDMSLTKIGIIKSLTFLGGLGFSRVIDEDENTALFLNDDDEWISYWNSSYLAGIRLPFRYGGSLAYSLQNDFFTSAGTVPLYSDIYFENDFSDRDENMDWSSMINPESTESDTSDGTSNETYKWKITNTVTPDVTSLKPYIGSLKITRLDFEISWKSKEIPEEYYEEYIPAGIDTSFDLPEKRFFYPASAVLPSFSAALSGVIFSSKAKDKNAAEEESETRTGTPVEGLRMPWESGDEDDTEEREDGESKYRAPLPISSVAIAKTKTYVPFSHSLSYQISPSMTNTSTFNTDAWETPDDVDSAILYSLLNVRGTASLTYQANVYENYVDFKNVVTFTGNYDHHYTSDTEQIEDWDSYAESDLDSTYCQIADTLTVAVSPFYGSTLLQPTKITYNLATTLYRGEYEEDLFTNSFIEWTEDYITTHKVNLVLGINQWDAKQTLSLESTLPPLDMELSPSLSLVTGPLTSVISTSVAANTEEEDETEEDWVFDPLTVKETFVLSDYLRIQQSILYSIEDSEFSTGSTVLSLKFFDSLLSLSEELAYDFSENTLTSSETKLTLGVFTCSYKIKDAYPYTFDDISGWVKGDEEELLPYSFSTGLKWNWDPDPFWKGRITFSSSISSTWDLNLIQFTENSFTFNTTFKLRIKEFLDFSFTSKSVNKSTFIYFRDMREVIGLSGEYDVISDLLKSFNFFDIKERYASNFNLKSLAITIVHHLHDWDLSFEYSGSPELITNDYGIKEYEWTPSFTIMVQWNPIPEIKRSIVNDNGTITY